MDEQFKQLVDGSKSILILLPAKPFFDQVASGLALFLGLRNAEKDVQIVSSAPITVDFNRLIGINKVTQELGSKNLIIKFLDYNPKDIERVKYDLEGDKTVYLSVIPMPGKKSPAKDQVQLSYSGVSADCVILIGGTNDSHFPGLSGKDLSNAKLVHIGTKDISLSDKHPISLSRPASSISELVYYFLKNSNIPIDQDIASDILMGIEESTRNFTDTNATADTFMAIADLMKHGARRYQSQSVISPAQFPPGAIPGQQPGGFPPMPPRTNLPPLPQMPQMPGAFPQMPQGMPPYPMQGQVPQIPGGFTQNPQMPRQMPQIPQMPQAGPMPNQTVQRSQARVQNAKPAPKPVDEDVQNEEFDNPPEEWLSKPKVYKGTSVN